MKLSLLILILAMLLPTFTYAEGTEYKTINLTINNTILYRSEFDKSFTDYVIREIDKLDKLRDPAQPIYVILDTPGGRVAEAMRLAKRVDDSLNIYFVVLNGYSAGAYITQFIPRKVFMVSGGNFMLHPITRTYTRPVTLEEIIAEGKNAETYQEIIMTLVSVNSGIPVPELIDFIRPGKTLKAEEAKQMNFVDEIVQIKCSARLVKAKVTVTEIEEHARTTYVFSKCPLIRDVQVIDQLNF